MPRRTTQGGFALIAAALLIVFVGIVGVFFAYLIGSGAQAGAEETLASQALYAAESGLERGTRVLLSPTLSDRVACNAITGTADLTNKALGVGLPGVFTLTGAAPDYATTVATLNGAVTATATTVPFTSAGTAPTYGMAAEGRAMIDGEAIAYAGIDTNAAVCGTAPCLVGVHRGLSGTTAVAHASGAPIGQYQCALTSEGGVPDIATLTSAKRTLSEGVTLQDGWIVGQPFTPGAANGWMFLRWNDRNTPNLWSRFTVAGGAGALQLNGVSMLSYTDGWAVGNSATGGSRGYRWRLFRWNAGTDTWTRYTNIVRDTGGTARGAGNLNAVDVTSDRDAWAVGDRFNNGGQRWGVLHWDGTSWTLINPGGTPQNLYGLDFVDTNGDGVADSGWAVGAGGTMLHYQNGTWSTYTLLWPLRFANYYGVTCLTDSDCIAVGDWEAVIRWNGSIWTQESLTFGNTLRAVTCADSSDCWAAGDGGDMQRYDATAGTWALTASATTNPLNGIDCLTTQDCWAVGDTGTMIHWDGSAWSTGPQNAFWSQSLRAISLVGAEQRPQGAWREVFP